LGPNLFTEISGLLSLSKVNARRLGYLNMHVGY